MRERPFIAKPWEVRAFRDGRKTQFRRVVKPQPMVLPPIDNTCLNCDWRSWVWREGNSVPEGMISWCPYGQPGDRLWVREAWARVGCRTECNHLSCRTIYRADEGNAIGCYGSVKWRPSIHMPRWASRIMLEIVSVRVERLNEISAVDAIDEGILSVRTDEWDRKHFPEYANARDLAKLPGTKPPLGPSPVEHFKVRWDVDYGTGSWDANPWVWVCAVKVVKP